MCLEAKTTQAPEKTYTNPKSSVLEGLASSS